MEKTGLEKPFLEKIGFGKTDLGKNRSTEPWRGGLLPPTPPATILQKRIFWKTVFWKMTFCKNIF